MEFKDALTHSSRAHSNSCMLNPRFMSKPEDLPSMNEEDLVCCESFSKLYLISKVLGKPIL